jgi:hypothetical protein
MAQAPRVEVFRDQFVLQPNPVSGGMADVYHAKDALNDMREVAVSIHIGEIQSLKHTAPGTPALSYRRGISMNMAMRVATPTPKT